MEHLQGNSTPSIVPETLEEGEIPVTSVTPATPDAHVTMTAAPTATMATYTTTNMEASVMPQAPPLLRHCASEPGQVNDLDELQEADLFSHGLDLTRMMEGHKESKSDVSIRILSMTKLCAVTR